MICLFVCFCLCSGVYNYMFLLFESGWWMREVCLINGETTGGLDACGQLWRLLSACLFVLPNNEPSSTEWHKKKRTYCVVSLELTYETVFVIIIFIHPFSWVSFRLMGTNKRAFYLCMVFHPNSFSSCMVTILLFGFIDRLPVQKNIISEATRSWFMRRVSARATFIMRSIANVFLSPCVWRGGCEIQCSGCRHNCELGNFDYGLVAWITDFAP